MGGQTVNEQCNGTGFWQDLFRAWGVELTSKIDDAAAKRVRVHRQKMHTLQITEAGHQKRASHQGRRWRKKDWQERYSKEVANAVLKEFRDRG